MHLSKHHTEYYKYCKYNFYSSTIIKLRKMHISTIQIKPTKAEYLRMRQGYLNSKEVIHYTPCTKEHSRPRLWLGSYVLNNLCESWLY